MPKRPHAKSEFVICINNKGYPASLELHKVYRVIPDEEAASDDDIRVVDESGEMTVPRLVFYLDSSPRSRGTRPVSVTRPRPSHRLITQTVSRNFTVLVDNKGMPDHEKIEVELIKLISGERLLRLTESRSGLSLETKLNPNQTVVRQKKQLLNVFEVALASAHFTPA